MNMCSGIATNEKAFTMKRVFMPSTSTVVAPQVVRCVWSPINIANLSAKAMTHEELDSVKGCITHEHCKGHLRTNADGTAYMIPSGFATADELRESEPHVFNRMLMDGRKSTQDMMNFCFDKVSGKNGIMRKMCNGSRPTNTCRFVASPSRGPMHVVYLPYTVFDKGVFLYTNPDGRCSTRKIEEGDVVIVGRCPSQGSDSSLPMRVMRGAEGETSIRVPLEICSKNNGDFDGDEMFVLVPMSKAGIEEAERAMQRVWGTGTTEDILISLCRIVPRNQVRKWVDPAIYTTMTFKEMITHPGGKAYDLMMLKPKVWRQMTTCMFNRSYWTTWVDRSEAGIANTIVGRHGVAGPYGVMRLGMMLGTCLSTHGSEFTIDSSVTPSIPIVDVPPGADKLTCSSAIAKLTKIIYQRGIDVSKHGKSELKIPAIEMLMKDLDNAYVLKAGQSGLALLVGNSALDPSSASLYTTLTSLSNSAVGDSMLRNALVITSMVEEIDSVMLTNQERLAFAIFICFVSLAPVPVMDSDSVKLMYGLELDWYTSFTCSDIRWFKYVLRDPTRYPHARMDTDISSTLGAIFIGNLDMITGDATSMEKVGTVATTALSYWDE